MDWFENLTGFRESGYDDTRSRLRVEGERICSSINGQSYGIGNLETPSLGDLRRRAQSVIPDVAGPLQVSFVRGDVRDLHRDPRNANALFQVASQFNLLEMAHYEIAPEDGVTRYAFDSTQGPACALAAGAATIYRNYFADVDGHSGQTLERQIDCLRDVGAAFGNDDNALWTMRNGYALCSEAGLASISHRLSAFSSFELAALRDLLRIGMHWDVEVTDAPATRHRVSQAFCSALPVGYSRIPTSQWQSFATLVLEGAYEATLYAAALNAQRSSNTVFLTRLGGGAFGNDPDWIDGALQRALDTFNDVRLDIRLVSR